MEPPEQELCEECGEKRASHYVCRPGQGPSRNLCKECYEGSLSGPERDFLEAMRKARCRFCGGTAMTSDSMTTILEGAGAEPRFFCASCSEEYNRLMLARLGEAEAKLDGVPADGQMKYLREIAAEVDALMKSWVQQRDN